MVTYIKTCFHIGNMAKREEMVKVYMTEDQKEEVQERAESKDLTISSYARTKILGEA